MLFYLLHVDRFADIQTVPLLSKRKSCVIGVNSLIKIMLNNKKKLPKVEVNVDIDFGYCKTFIYMYLILKNSI